MKILGIEIKHPSPSGLALAAVFIATVCGFGVIFHTQGIVGADAAWVTVVGTSTGALLSAFGVSLRENGWRAAVLMITVGSVIYLLIV